MRPRNACLTFVRRCGIASRSWRVCAWAPRQRTKNGLRPLKRPSELKRTVPGSTYHFSRCPVLKTAVGPISCSFRKQNVISMSDVFMLFRWMSHVRNVLSAGWAVAFKAHTQRTPVLVHCSHGWDRTSQVRGEV